MWELFHHHFLSILNIKSLGWILYLAALEVVEVVVVCWFFINLTDSISYCLCVKIFCFEYAYIFVIACNELILGETVDV